MFECEIEEFVSGQKFRKVYEKKCEYLLVKYDLKKIELDVLFFLHRYESLNTAKDIVNNKCLSKAHVSNAVDSLARKNYVVACTDSGDRRCLQLTITSQARPVVEELNIVWNQILEIIYCDLSKEEIEILEKAIAKINKNIDGME